MTPIASAFYTEPADESEDEARGYQWRDAAVVIPSSTSASRSFDVGVEHVTRELVRSLVPSGSVGVGRSNLASLYNSFIVDHDDYSWGNEFAAGVSEVSAEIARSRSILALCADWDDEGSPAFKQSTWERAIALMRAVVRFGVFEYRGRVSVPRIGPANDGSIDVYWKGPDPSLLINVPAEEAAPATYAGHRADGSISGELGPDASRVGHLAAWLANAE